MPRIENLIGGLRRAEQELEKRLKGIRDAIASLGGGRGGRKAGNRAAAAGGTRKRRKLSAKGRAAISRAQKARWARQRAAQK